RCTCLASKARFHKSLGHRPWDVFSVYPKLITRNSGMLPDSWRGHFVRVPAQVTNLRDTSGKMPELRPESDPNRTSENLLTLNTYQVALGNGTCLRSFASLEMARRTIPQAVQLPG